MVLRLLQIGNSLPFSMPVALNAEFQPGQIAQIYTENNQIVAGVSDGSAPFGIIDDIRTNSFTRASIDEVIRIEPPELAMYGNAVAADGYGGFRLTMPIKKEISYPNVLPKSFISDQIDVDLNPINGIVTFLAGTELNYDSNGDGFPDSVQTIVNYIYQIPNVPGDDSTYGSGRITVWFNRMIFETDQFDTSARYTVSAPLFVNESGLLTTRQINPNYPAVALCMAPANTLVGTIQAMWF